MSHSIVWIESLAEICEIVQYFDVLYVVGTQGILYFNTQKVKFVFFYGGYVDMCLDWLPLLQELHIHLKSLVVQFTKFSWPVKRYGLVIYVSVRDVLCFVNVCNNYAFYCLK